MVNTRKAVLRERTRLRKGQNPHQIDFKRMRKARKTRTEYWKLMKRTRVKVSLEEEPKSKKKAKKEKKPKKDTKPEIEVIDEDLEEIYSLDEDLDELDEEGSD